MQGHRDQGHLDSLREHHEPITCEETKVVTTADVLQELFPALPVMDAAWTDTVADEEVEVFGTEDTNSSEGFEDCDNLLNPHVIGVPDLSDDEASLENEEFFSQQSLIHLADTLQDEASNFDNLFSSEAGRARTLAYNKCRIGTALYVHFDANADNFQNSISGVP